MLVLPHPKVDSKQAVKCKRKFFHRLSRMPVRPSESPCQYWLMAVAVAKTLIATVPSGSHFDETMIWTKNNLRGASVKRI